MSNLKATQLLDIHGFLLKKFAEHAATRLWLELDSCLAEFAHQQPCSCMLALWILAWLDLPTSSGVLVRALSLYV